MSDIKSGNRGLAETVVGVGASAGGLEALEKLLDGAKADGRCAYVVVTHLSPNFKSLLDELLQRHTAMEVVIIEDGMTIRADVVYVMPPNVEMIVNEGKLCLSRREQGPVQTLPINIFFSSLAREYGSRAIAVILSGSGSDGSRGVEEIRSAGGLVIVQNPDTARFESMPRAAIASGIKTHVTEAEKIGAVIAARSAGGLLTSLPPSIAGNETDERADKLAKILQHIYVKSNVDFSLYKLTTIYRRVRRRMLTRGHRNLEQYYEDLQNDPKEFADLTDDLLISVTEFYRDKEAFDFMVTHIIPDLVAKSSESKRLRIWVTACSTGEEAYTIAVLIYLESRRQGKRVDPQIYATDLKQSSIQHAGAGIYSARQIANLPEEGRDLCFEDIGDDEYRIIQPIRGWLVFAEHNILRDPPFTRLDLITCRNMLIYFEQEAQHKILSLLNFGLRDQGVLFLGRSESLGVLEDDFHAVSQSARVYRKTGASASVRLSIGSRLASADEQINGKRQFGSSSLPITTGKPRLGPAYAALIDAFIPTGALVTTNREVLHLFGSADEFLRPPKGAMDPDILKMAAPELRVPIAAAIDRARNEKGEVVFRNVEVIEDSGPSRFNLRVVPLVSPTVGDIKHLFVGFEKDLTEPAAVPISGAQLLDASSLETERVSSLERELAGTRENLQATIEEVETSNEELQSTNEELMASNEELQSTNEELQSVNEELYTVNGEYQKKNDELEEVTRDIDNLISSTEIGVLFVDGELHMRRFTDAITSVLNVVPADIGRSLPDITHRLVGVDLAGLISTVLNERRLHSVEVRDEDDVWWQVRVIPLAAKKGRGDGAVVTIYNVTDLRQAKMSAEDRLQDLRIVAKLTGAGAIRQRPDGSFDTAQEGWCTLSGQRDEATLDFGWIEAAHPDNRDRLMRFWKEAVPDPEVPLQTHVRVRSHGDEFYRHITLLSTPEFGEGEQLNGWITVAIDVEDAVQSNEIVRDAEIILHKTLDILPSRVSYVDREWRYRYVNRAYEDGFGVTRRDVLSKKVEDVLPPEIFAQSISPIQQALAGEPTETTVRGFSEVGDEEILHIHYEPDIQADGSAAGLAMSVRDITNAVGKIDDNLQSKALVTHALTKSSLCIVTLQNANSAFSFVSDSVTALTGFSVLELRKKSLVDLLPEFDSQRLEELMQRASKLGEEFADEATFMITRSGDSVDVEIEVGRLRHDAAGEIIVVIRDRTVSRGAEAALRRRTEQLSQSNRMLEIFAAAATHELTSPLRRVSKFSELLKSDYKDVLDKEGAEFLDLIVDETTRMRRTIDSVMELARLERVDLKLADVDLAAAIVAAKSELVEQIDQSKASIETNSLPVVLGDQNQLAILFRNLLANAITHVRPGVKPLVSINCTQAEGFAVIDIADNGRGIASGRDADVFLPFVRVDSAKESIGMGLALCRRIAEAHGGTLELKRSTPEGSVFQLRLRLRAANDG